MPSPAEKRWTITVCCVLSSAKNGFPSLFYPGSSSSSKPTQRPHLSESLSTDLVSRESATGPSSQWLSAPDAALTLGPTSGSSFLTVHHAHHISSMGASPSRALEPDHLPPASPPLDQDLTEFSAPTCPPAFTHPRPTMN